MYRFVIAKTIQKIGDAPEKILLFAEGWQEVEGDGKFLVDRQGFEALRAYVASRGVDIVFDYEHQTIKDIKAPAAGWIRGADALEYVPGTGIVATVDWTEEAAGYIERGEYRYFSPVFSVRKTDRRLAGMHSVALTNSPKTNNLKPILAKLGSQPKEEGMNFFQKLLAKLGLAEGASEDDTLAAVDAIAADAKTAKTVRAKLSVAENADAETVTAAIDSLAKDDNTVVAKEIADALDISGDKPDVSTVVASINALKHNGKAAVDDRVQKLEAKLAERDATDAVTAAKAAGKITPDQEEWAMDYAKKDLDGFSAFVAKAAQVVPVDDLPGKTKKPEKTAADENTLAIAAKMGVSKEDMEKYGQA